MGWGQPGPAPARRRTGRRRRSTRGLSAAVDDDTAGGIVRGEGHGDLVPEHHADAVLAQLASEMGQDLVTVLQLDLEIACRQDLDDAALKFYVLFAAHGLVKS